MDTIGAFAAKQYAAIARIVERVGRAPDGMAVIASWDDGRGWEAGVTADATSLSVFFGPAVQAVESLEEALALLQGIFADTVVCVTALENETPVHHALAPHDDPSASFTALDKPSGFNMPAIDNVLVRSWTGARDRE